VDGLAEKLEDLRKYERAAVAAPPNLRTAPVHLYCKNRGPSSGTGDTHCPRDGHLSGRMRKGQMRCTTDLQKKKGGTTSALHFTEETDEADDARYFY